MLPEKKHIQNVRNEVLNISLIVFSLACLPALLASLYRSQSMGWQHVMTLQIVVVLVLMTASICRHSLNFQTRVFLFLSSLFLLGVMGFWSFGLIGAGVWFFFSLSIFATVLFGVRWGWISLGATLAAISGMSFAIVSGFIDYDFDMNVYAVSPGSLFTAVFGVALFLSTITVCLGKFHASMLALIEELSREIEERKDAENALQKSEEKFRKIIEKIQDVYFETTVDGTIRYCSPSCLPILGYSQEELIGQQAEILYRDANDRQVLLEGLLSKGSVRGLELVFKRKNGDFYDVSFNADPIFDESGAFIGLNGTIRDVTEAKKAKRQIQQAKKMEAVGLMAGGVAHDLNNILSGIISYPELILMKLTPDNELRKPIERIKESGQRAALVVADLLTVAKGSADAKAVQDLHTIVEQYFHSPEYEKIMQLYPNVDCHNDLAAKDSYFSCSAVHIKKCLMNLVNNGVEAVPDRGAVIVSTSNHTVDKSFSVEHGIPCGKTVVLNVCDSGLGISEDDLEHIFEPFYTKKIMERGGTGLGLAIVWNTVRDHGGCIVVENCQEGTCFRLYFPLAQTEEWERDTEKSCSDIQGRGEHILVVDDTMIQRDIAESILKEHNYTVDVVSSGEEALVFVQRQAVDLLLLDMLMEPGMNGRETYEEICKFYPGQKAILSSGFSETEEVNATLKQGVGQFIKKPYSMKELLTAIRKELDR